MYMGSSAAAHQPSTWPQPACLQVMADGNSDDQEVQRSTESRTDLGHNLRSSDAEGEGEDAADEAADAAATPPPMPKGLPGTCRTSCWKCRSCVLCCVTFPAGYQLAAIAGGRAVHPLAAHDHKQSA